MKKNYFIALFFASFFSLFAQDDDLLISFETSENFVLGELNGQNGWVTNADYSSFINITDEKSSDGDYALHFESDPNGPMPNNGITGALNSGLNFGTNLSFSLDLWIESGDDPSSSTEFNILLQSPTQELLTSRVAMFDTQIFIVATDPMGQLQFLNAGFYPTDEWFELKMDFDFTAETIIYSINGNEILTGDVFGATQIEELLLFSSFNQTGFYVDNIKFESETLSVSGTDAITFSVFPNPTTDVLTIQSPNALSINSVKVFNVSGKQVKVELNNNQVDVNHLSSGVYMMNVQTDEGSKTVKFIKK